MKEVRTSDVRLAIGELVEDLLRGEVLRLVRYGRGVALILPLQPEAQAAASPEDIEEARRALGPMLSRLER